MSSFSTFRDYVSAVRSGPSQIICLSARDVANSKSASINLPREGITSAFTGHHIYTMLQLRPGLTTSSLNADRKKNVTLLADLAQGIREIVHSFDGALLEVQGPVVHAFIPNESGTRSDARQAAYAIHAFIETRIRSKAGTDFLKGLVAFSHGPTIFVAAEDSHGDNSIVSLAPAANAPAKVLWRNHDNLSNGTILEVEIDGRFRELGENELVTEWEKRASATVINASLQLPDIVALEAKAFSVPPPASSPLFTKRSAWSAVASVQSSKSRSSRAKTPSRCARAADAKAPSTSTCPRRACSTSSPSGTSLCGSAT